MNESHYSFSALQGIQGRQAVFLLQLPLKVISKLIKQDDMSLPVDQRGQRMLNKTRVAQITKYVLDNPDTYVLPPLVGYVKYGLVQFDSFEGSFNLGKLNIAIDAEILLSDGQHRRAALEEAVKHRKFLGEETIGLMLYVGKGVEQAQQVFADININATKPAQSIKLLYNHRDQYNTLTRSIINEIPLFKDFVDFERTNLPAKSDKFFTFSGLYQAFKVMVKDHGEDFEAATAQTFWEQVCLSIPEWNQLENGQVLPEQLREQYVHAHSVVWLALASVSKQLMDYHPTDWHQYIEKLSTIDWSRDNLVWKDRCVVGGRISKTRQNIILTANQIMQEIGLELPKAYQEVEDTYLNAA
ncbi:DNA sulfur modification protein DndB [Acinetobacter radioresistens]|uniref:DNA sulfur modification protein DndB n=1 Tax=Acinetobacter radioresistens TaxID=40216 RepID=UPI0005B351AF|nr:DNA sulfur modification protein DndB [Acinetobacter radioresistens]